MEIVVLPPPLRKAGQAKSNHRYQESKFILCKQIFHLVISMCSISCFTSFQSQLMLIPTFIVFLIPLRTFRREERQAGFSIHVCADNSQLDSVSFFQNPLGWEITVKNNRSTLIYMMPEHCLFHQR